MAVEAQLCPQCGATVRFAEMQTEVVCSYCGATVDKTLVQSIQRVNDVGQLSAENQAKVNQLILDGRRKDALFFIQQYTGLGEASANVAIDKTINDWGDAHRQPWAASIREILVVAGIIAIDLLAIVALVYAAAKYPGKNSPAAAILDCGIFWVVISGIYVVTAVQWIIARVSVTFGQAGPAALQKVVPLPLADSSASPHATVITRLLIEVTAPGMQPRVNEIKMDLPPETAGRLRPGNKVEAITNGPKFVYVTDPIKVLG